MEALQLYVRYAAGCGGAGAGGRKRRGGMQPYAVKEGGWSYSSSTSLSKYTSFYIVGFLIHIMLEEE